LFGCHPYESEYSLFCKKVGLVPPREDTERLKVGRFLEQAILSEWKGRYAYAYSGGSRGLFHNTDIQTHRAYYFITATPDAMGFETDERGDEYKIVADVKTVEPMRRADWNAGVPEYYRLQIEQQMLVTGAKRGVLIALFGFNELSHEWIDADPVLQNEIVKRITTFWKRVQGELPPPEADGSDATTDALKARVLTAKAIELPPDVREWEGILAGAEKEVKKHEAVVQEMKNKIRASLGDATVGIHGDGSGWRVQTINRREVVTKASTYTKLVKFEPKEHEKGSE
jgi:predicted phage-related endonuclease